MTILIRVRLSSEPHARKDHSTQRFPAMTPPLPVMNGISKASTSLEPFFFGINHGSTKLIQWQEDNEDFSVFDSKPYSETLSQLSYLFPQL